tara:strand:- start:210 stop:614 length:405 start_codon:yes stop_codon:yes gene_type:complete
MAKKLKLDQVAPEIRRRLDKFMDEYVTGLQVQLAEDAPYETGRLASSWRIGQGSPNREVEPERDAPGDVTITDFPGQITFGPPYYVSSNIEYAERLCLDPSFPIKTAPKDWFTRIVNQAPKLADKKFVEAFRGF